GPLVPGHPGRFEGEDGADTTFTHRREPWAEPGTLVASRAAPADVLIDHDDLGKAQTAGLIRQGRWPPLAFGVRAHVMVRGRAARDVGVPLERERVHRGAHGSTPRSGHCG